MTFPNEAPAWRRALNQWRWQALKWSPWSVRSRFYRSESWKLHLPTYVNILSFRCEVFVAVGKPTIPSWPGSWWLIASYSPDLVWGTNYFSVVLHHLECKTEWVLFHSLDLNICWMAEQFLYLPWMNTHTHIVPLHSKTTGRSNVFQKEDSGLHVWPFVICAGNCYYCPENHHSNYDNIYSWYFTISTLKLGK